MGRYIISVNPTKSNIDSIFDGRTWLYWIHRRGNHARYQPDEILYMYVSSPVKQIRFKVRVLRTNVEATEEELGNPTWFHREDLEEQVNNNCNDAIELIEELPVPNRTRLSLSELYRHGLNKRIWAPVDITDNAELVEYIESVFR